MLDVSFRPLTRGDFPLLARWLAAPHVVRWWDSEDEARDVEKHYGPAQDGKDPTEHYVIELEGRPIGMIQVYLLADHPAWERIIEDVAPGLPTSAGIDYLIGEPDATGKGVGTAAIRAFVDLVFERFPEVKVIIADAERANIASWRALERVGFERRYEGMLDSGEEGEPPTDSVLYVLGRGQSRGAEGEAGS